MNNEVLNKFLNNSCSETERALILSWLLDASNDQKIREWMKLNWDDIQIECDKIDDKETDIDIGFIWLKLQERIREESFTPQAVQIVHESNTLFSISNIRRVMSIAAILLIMLGGLLFFLINNNNHHSKNSIVKGKNSLLTKDVEAPSGNKAILTLGNGKKIEIDDSETGELVKEGEVEVVRTTNGEIVYKGNTNTTVSYNTLSIPKGSKPMRLLLSDGTMVWLNAASSITYPNAFIGNERRVKISGEAYFEVAKNASKPFYVNHDEMMVRVLGTHFNINAYEDEKGVKVTLLEGKVDVSSGNKNALLIPGQQAELKDGKIEKKDGVDLSEVMAWKNGEFYFNGVDLKTIMRQIEKYYDVEVVFEVEYVPYSFYAKIDRSVNVSEFLKKLEMTNLIHFKIESNRITVTK